MHVGVNSTKMNISCKRHNISIFRKSFASVKLLNLLMIFKRFCVILISNRKSKAKLINDVTHSRILNLHPNL